MIAPHFNSLCKEAELYYYTFLFSKTQRLVPESIINHIRQCQNCREQIKQLEVILSQVDDMEPEQKQVNSAVTTMLSLHFVYLGKPITCEVVRPFLSSLLDPALEIRIPTPITVHLDKCQRCSEELEAIRSLNLSRIQLRRLSQLFADKDTRHGVSCAQTHAAILKVLAMNLQETIAEDLKHLSMCPYCRKLLYQYREAMRNELLKKKIDQRFPCQDVSASDIFDYVVPYGLDPAKDQYAKFRESLATHLRNCPTCLAKMQQLHNTAYGIVKRPESGIVTIYHIDESAKAKAISESNDLYASFPVRVEITSREGKVKTDQPAPAIDFGVARKQKLSARKLKPLLKPVAAAAAVILIAIALFLNIPTAKAVTIKQIYEALEKVRNVYIASFVPDKKEPIQEQWVSRELKVQQIKTEKELVLWDLSNRIKKVRHLDSNSVETTKLSTETITDIQNTITGSLGLVPFYDVSEVPTDAKWSHVDDENVEVTESIEGYDLMWTEKAYDGSIIHKKWRFFADPKTNLPKRTEFYQMLPTDDNYIFISAMEIKYLSDSEMQEVIKEVPF